MSTQPTSIVLGQHLGAAEAEPAASDLQQVIGKVLAVLSCRRWLFIVPLLLGILGSLAVSLFLPRHYVVTTIFERRDDMVVSKLVSTNSPYSFGTHRRSLKINLQGYHALGAAVEDLGLTRDFPRDEHGAYTPEGLAKYAQLVGGLVPCVDVDLLESGDFLDLVQVRYRGPDPELGVALVSQLRDNYISNTQALLSDILHKSKEFFGQETARYGERAAKLEAELLELSLAHPGVDPASPDVLSQRLMAVGLGIEDRSMRRADLESKIANLTEYLQDLEQRPPMSQPASWPPAPGSVWLPNPQRQRLQTVIDGVKTQIADLKAVHGMRDAHPRVEGLRKKLEQLRIEYERTPQQIAGAPSPSQLTPLSPAQLLDPLAGERKRVEMELKSLRQDIARVDRELAKHKAEKKLLEQEKGELFERREHFLIRKQETQNAQDELRAWKGHVDTVSRLLAADESNRGIGFATVDKARQPRTPKSPTLGGVFLLSSGVGLALATAVVFLREVFDRSFRDPAKVRQSLGIPVLETIGEIRAGQEPGRLNRRVIMPVVVAVEALAVVTMAAIVFLSLHSPNIYNSIMAGEIPKNWLAGIVGG